MAITGAERPTASKANPNFLTGPRPLAPESRLGLPKTDQQSLFQFEKRAFRRVDISLSARSNMKAIGVFFWSGLYA